jgi:trans-2,3-dihydro-3-hydroxyanthranilate isomerase
MPHAELAHPYEVLDVFTDTPLEGNPLAVFSEGESIPSRLMQAAARELRLSETVFLIPGDEHCDAQLRIFTPASELPFAGHPVLGSAFVVGERQSLATVRLMTGAGLVPVTLTREHGEIVYGEMEQPLPTVTTVEEPAALLAALGVTEPLLPVEVYVNGPQHLMVALDSAEAVGTLEPNHIALAHAARAAGLDQLTVSCFAKLSAGTFKSRVFCPALGIPEDPATGSAAGPLALHCARHGLSEFGETIEIIQGVEILRPSRLNARAERDGEQTVRVVVGGSAVRVAHGHFRLQ